jgi:flagellar motor switch protein FliM
MTEQDQLIPADQLEAIRTIHQRFCRALESPVATCLQTTATTLSTEIGQGWESGGPVHGEATVFTLDLKPFPGRGFAWVSHSLARAALELLLGTGPDSQDQPERPLTSLDLHILRDLFDAIFRELRAAWSPYCPCALTPEMCEPRAEPPALEGLVDFGVEVSLGTASGMIWLALPSLLVRLAAQRSREQASAQEIPATPDAKILDALRSAQLKIDTVLGGGHLRLRDLLDLKPGQVILLPHPAGTPVLCEINGKAKLKGEILSTERGIAFSVAGWLPADGNAPQSRQP